MYRVCAIPVWLLLIVALRPLPGLVGNWEEVRLRPCIKVQSQVGESARERRKHAKRMAEHIADTSQFFMKVYSLKPQDFIDYAEHRSSEDSPFDVWIRIRFWARHEDFLADFQQRYRTETVPGAYFGIIREKDDYGEYISPWYREIGCFAEGQTHQEVLRHLYHEMGHLFMKTFIVYNFEIPSWIEEGTAELFQYREDNGTYAEAERREREGWLVEIVRAPEGDPSAIMPWGEFTQVSNMDNLSFTYQNPMRATIQYAQAWSVAEYFIATHARRAAYTRFLHSMRDTGKEILHELARKGKNGRALIDATTKTIYQRQYDIFQQAYRTDLFAIEKQWKEWVVESFEDKAAKRPELHYYRGDWHLSHRLRYAADATAKEDALSKAEAAFTQALEGAPDRPEGHVGMGRLAMARGQHDEANEHFARAAELGADSFEAQIYGGIALVRQGRAAQAVEPLSKAVAARESHYEANLYYGWALAASDGDADKALRHLERAQEIKSERRAFPALLAGIVHFRVGDHEAARRQWLRAQMGMADNQLLPLLLILENLADEERAEALANCDRAEAAGNPLAKHLAAAIETGQAKTMVPGFAPGNCQPGIENLTFEAAGSDPDAPAAP